MNVQELSIKTSQKREHNPLLPSSLRGLIIGKSNSGKTVLLLNLLLRNNWLDYNNLLVFGNSLHQEEYQVIKRGFEKGLGKDQILNLFNNQNLLPPLEAINAYNGEFKGGVTAEFYEDCDAIPDPKTLDPKKKNLIILDDCYLGKQSKAGAYYSRGRHNSCCSLYISQNYFSLPRNSVRENSNIIILFPQNNKSVQNIHQDHCTDIPFDEFRNLCRKIWDTKYNFLTIDLSSPLKGGKYRENLDRFYIPGDMAFIDIVDPVKRNETVAEYVKTRNMIRVRNENNKESNLIKEQEIERNLRPIVTATEKSADKIASVLKNDAKTPYEFYSSMTKNKDQNFGIYRQEDGFFKLGNSIIQIDEDNNIHISGTTYVYSSGLWNLIMLNKPHSYSEEDLETYREIVKATDLINNPRNSSYKRTLKFKFLENLFGEKKDGHGIVLPGDINGLKARLQLVCAERAAGNVEATTPEIVGILDELLRRNYLSRAEYNEVCKKLEC